MSLLFPKLPLTFWTEFRPMLSLTQDYQKLVQYIKEGVVRRYWLEDNLLQAKGDKRGTLTGIT